MAIAALLLRRHWAADAVLKLGHWRRFTVFQTRTLEGIVIPACPRSRQAVRLNKRKKKSKKLGRAQVI